MAPYVTTLSATTCPELPGPKLSPRAGAMLLTHPSILYSWDALIASNPLVKASEIFSRLVFRCSPEAQPLWRPVIVVSRQMTAAASSIEAD